MPKHSLRFRSGHTVPHYNDALRDQQLQDRSARGCVRRISVVLVAMVCAPFATAQQKPRQVYHAAPLIAAQLLFAYAFDSLLSWTHRRTFALGFGPFPIIFSFTLFFWFKDDQFYPQFGPVALGLLAKEFLRWTRHLLLLRFACADCHVPWHAPAVHRPGLLYDSLLRAGMPGF